MKNDIAEYVKKIQVLERKLEEERNASSRNDVDIKKKYGDGCWALITGATDGIGKGFC